MSRSIISPTGLANSAKGTEGVLNEIMRMDGSGSGLDADLLDGKSANSFQPRINWKIVSTNTTALYNDGIIVNTTLSPLIVTLPSNPSIGAIIAIRDVFGTIAANNITIARGGSNIMGLAEDMTVNINFISFTLTYVSITQGWILG